jgi:hypothetical protein
MLNKQKIIGVLLIATLLPLAMCKKEQIENPETTGSFYVPDITKGTPRQGFTLLDVDSYQQTTEYSCGPSAVITLLKYFGKEGDEMVIAEEMGTSTTTGTTPEQMATWLDAHGFKASWHENGNLDTLTNNLKKQIPTLIEWSDWGGHWVLVVGYDTRNTETISDDVIIFADPYDRHDDNIDGITWFNAERFYYMWYDALLFGSLMRHVYISAAPDQ